MVAEIDRNYFLTNPKKTYSRLLAHLLFQGRPITTSGRWMNSMLSIFLTGLSKFSFGKDIYKPIYIAGVGRSGTTILGKVLSMHRDIGWLNEPKLLWHIAFPSEDVIGNYDKVNKSRYYLDQGDVDDLTRKSFQNLYSNFLLLDNSNRVLDKYPEVIFRTKFVDAIFPDAIYILIKRNGWDNISSIQTWNNNNQNFMNGKSQNWWGINNRKWQLLNEQIIPMDPLLSDYREEIRFFQDPIDMAVVEWIVSMNIGLIEAERIPERFHIVSYEKLTHLPEVVIPSILSFCDLKNDISLTNYALKVLKPNPRRSSTKIHPILVNPFSETMKRLGYEG